MILGKTDVQSVIYLATFAATMNLLTQQVTISILGQITAIVNLLTVDVTLMVWRALAKDDLPNLTVLPPTLHATTKNISTETKMLVSCNAIYGV